MEYKILKLERVATPYGETILISLEGLTGDEAVLTVYMPRRYNEAISDDMITGYNNGACEERLHLVRRAVGSANNKHTRLELC